MSLSSDDIAQQISILRSLPTIRARCSQVHALAQQNRLQYFSYHPDKEQDAVEFCLGLMRRDFPNGFDEIPAHGRWRHFDVDHQRIAALLSSWSASSPPVPVEEQCARLLDLFLVSVLLDAGAGNQWKYREQETGESYGRSEGLAIASLDMFKAGVFSSDQAQPCRVDAEGLAQLTEQKIGEAMQVSESNPMSGLSGRASLLVSLATALRSNPRYFGEEGRPGNLLKFIRPSAPDNKIHISKLWEVVIEGLASIWPRDRMNLGGVALGDVWRCDALAEYDSTTGGGEVGDGLVPFHKLSQWLTYSLVEPVEKLMQWKFEGLSDMTGLPEYRNGGLLIDFGILSLKPDVLDSKYYPNPNSKIPRLPPSHPAIIEWRAMTVIELDRIASRICQTSGTNLALAQILEAATWKGGREIASKLRGSTGGGPPVEIESDGTVF